MHAQSNPFQCLSATDGISVAVIYQVASPYQYCVLCTSANHLKSQYRLQTPRSGRTSKASIGDCQGRAKRSWNGGLVRHSSSESLAGELRPCRGGGPSATQRPAWHSIPGRAPSEDAALAAGGENGVMWTDRRRRLSWRWCGGREDPEQLEPESPCHCVVSLVMDLSYSPVHLIL